MAGDVVAILKGSAMPVVLRPAADVVQLVGTCYIHSAMDGVEVKNSQIGHLQNV